jgi:hypothetical protein
MWAFWIIGQRGLFNIPAFYVGRSGRTFQNTHSLASNFAKYTMDNIGPSLGFIRLVPQIVFASW